MVAGFAFRINTFSPYPPTPLPRRGRGRPKLFYARGFAPCIPGLGGARHWWTMPVAKERGDRGGGTSAFEMVLSPPGQGEQVPPGCLLSLPPAHPAFALLSCPLSPQPPSPAGKGEILGCFMQGASPLASPGVGRGAALEKGANHAPGGGRTPYGAGGRGASRCPAGVLAFFAACPPCLCFTFLPLSPQPPSPVGKGEI